MIRSMSKMRVNIGKQIRCYGSETKSYDNKIYRFMLMKAIQTKNSELIDVMERSMMLPLIVKMDTFKDVCVELDYDDVDFMLKNTIGIRDDLESYISYTEKDTRTSEKLENTLCRLEQELN